MHAIRRKRRRFCGRSAQSTLCRRTGGGRTAAGARGPPSGGGSQGFGNGVQGVPPEPVGAEHHQLAGEAAEAGQAADGQPPDLVHDGVVQGVTLRGTPRPDPAKVGEPPSGVLGHPVAEGRVRPVGVQELLGAPAQVQAQGGAVPAESRTPVRPLPEDGQDHHRGVARAAIDGAADVRQGGEQPAEEVRLPVQVHAEVRVQGGTGPEPALHGALQSQEGHVAGTRVHRGGIRGVPAPRRLGHLLVPRRATGGTEQPELLQMGGGASGRSGVPHPVRG